MICITSENHVHSIRKRSRSRVHIDGQVSLEPSYCIVLYIQFPSIKPYGQAVTHLEELVGESYGGEMCSPFK